jgi:K+-transporting ATPase ATPase B chain
MSTQSHSKATSFGDRKILRRATIDSFWKLDPRLMIKNPVMFVVEVGAVLTLIVLVRNALHHAPGFGFGLQITLWLWFTVLFANFAEAMAEGRGKAQAETLRKARAETDARRERKDGSTEIVPSSALRAGDVVLVAAGELIPGDGEVIEGVASVDESAITGESAPVIRESGGDRSAVTGGTRVLSDEIKVRITSNPGETFLDRMISLVEGASRQKTPNEIALNILLAGLTIIFLLAVATLQPFAIYSGAPQNVFSLVSLLVCLIPTTIGGLLSAIGIAGMDRMIQRNVIAMSGRAVEASGDVDVLLLDKTGTITLGNRQATAFHPSPGITEAELANAAQLASFADETPRPVDRGSRQRQIRASGQGTGAAQSGFYSLFRSDVHVGIGHGWARNPQGVARSDHPICRGKRPCCSRGNPGCGETGFECGRDAAAGGAEPPSSWGDRTHGRREGRNARALRAPPRHGHPHDDDHGR